MQLKQLEKILMVEQCGSISKAAEQLGTTQSALSKAINDFEDELGVMIFMRSANGVMLTKAGREVIRLAKNIRVQMDNICVLAGEKDNLHGTLRAAMLPALYNAVAAQVVKEFKEMYPMAELQLIEMGTNDALMAVAKGECHLGMGMFLPEEEKRYMTLLADLHVAYTLLSWTRFKVFMSAEHPLAAQKQIRRADLEEQVIFEYLNNNMDLLIGCREGKTAGQRFKVYNRETLKKLISLNCGVAILPEYMEWEDHYIQNGLIKSRFIEDYTHRIGCYWPFPQKSIASPLGNSFIIMISKYMESLSKL